MRGAHKQGHTGSCREGGGLIGEIFFLWKTEIKKKIEILLKKKIKV